MFEEVLLNYREFLLVNFNKEAIGIFSLFCIGFFGLASIFMLWALKNDQLSGLEDSKYEMLAD